MQIHQALSLAPDRFDAECLLARQLGVSRAYLFSHANKSLQCAELSAWMATIMRLNAGEPAAYLLGEVPFWTFDKIIVNENVLIPRADSETLVRVVLDFLVSKQIKNPNIMELGTGSGALSCAVAKALPHALCHASDASAGALQVAKQNAENLAIPNLQFYLGNWENWFAPFEHHQNNLKKNKFDLIFSNPPYLANDDPHLPDLAHEPRTALCSGTTGLEDFEKIIGRASDFLQPNGGLFLEHGIAQADFVQQILKQHGFVQINTTADLAGRARVTGGIHGGVITSNRA